MAVHPDPRFCNCCTPGVVPAPAVIFNRPGLAQISYRIGTFGTFRKAMLDQIHRQPELAGLLTRESDDHAITLLELMAAMGDVLTFYNERIGNEMYLRQALHKASVEQLTALVGYIPRPALSATTALAFEIEPGKTTRLWQGLRVMSVPGPDETAQIFETLEEIRGAGRLNAVPVMAPFLRFNAFAEARSRAPLAAPGGPAPGDRFAIFGDRLIEVKEAGATETGPRGSYLNWSPPVQAADLDTIFLRAAPVLRRLLFFGHNAPDSYTAYNPDSSEAPQNRWRSRPIDVHFPASAQLYPLSAKVDDLEPGAHLLLDAGPGTASDEPRLRTARVIEVTEGPVQLPTSPVGDTPPAMTDTVTRIRVRRTILGRPALVPQVGSNPFIVMREGGGTPALAVADPGPQSLFPPAAVLPALSSDVVGAAPPGDLFLFARNRRGGLSYTSVSNALNWQDLGGLLTSPPVAVALAGARVRVFVRGAEAELWMFDVTGGPALPQPLGGLLASDPTAVTPDGIRIAVFARGVDDALWWREHDGADWSGWESLGGAIAGTPAATATGAGRYDVFARGKAGGVLHFRQASGGWQPPRDIGGDPAGDPAAIGGGPDWALCAVRNRDGRLAHLYRSAETWSGWTDQGGTLGSDPSLAASASQLHVAARFADGTLATAVLSTGLPTWVRHGEGWGGIDDRREARLYEIGGSDIAFRDYDYPDRTSGGWLSLPLEPGEDPDDAGGLGPLAKGRKIILSDGIRQHRAEVVQRLAVPSAFGRGPDHLAVGIAPPLPGTAAQVTLMGNVAEASHGETRREEALGGGDATVPFQSFRVPPGEITHLPQATEVRPRPQVELRVDGVLWQEVPHLYGRSAKERAFTLRLPADAEPRVRGGDGLRAGARFPTGALNVRLTRRLGAGLAGNLSAGQLTVALEKPVGLRGVTNPLAASGGAPGETAEDARTAAPDGMRTFGRIVSLRDFAALALASGLVARADEAWVWMRMQRTAHLTVAGPGGAALPPETLVLLHGMLTASRDPNRPLVLANMVRIPVALNARLLRDPAYRSEDVAEAARRAVLEVFDFGTVGIGRPVHLSNAHALLQSVPGVLAVDIDLLQLADHADLTPAERKLRAVTAAPVQPHIRLFRARPTPQDPARIDRYQSAAFAPGPPPPVLPAEQAYIADPATDLQLTVVEAL
ncbi:putative baseplate assembly protein [Salipiger thiooxidans]|uniref:Putative baseplate assembly protein n=1 Tax=Salipiger thiooxidans TaxID=282683 RepID=A0A1G7L209_9RHOB|nr:hypothetical protein [Salipiger thiooxidans]SDF43518.1 putative baseplate assembly protein [Salipiger thiooxidans]